MVEFISCGLICKFKNNIFVDDEKNISFYSVSYCHLSNVIWECRSETRPVSTILLVISIVILGENAGILMCLWQNLSFQVLRTKGIMLMYATLQNLIKIFIFKAFYGNIICHNKLVSLGMNQKNDSTLLLKQLHKIIQLLKSKTHFFFFQIFLYHHIKPPFWQLKGN